jgi:DNA-binding transcriptional LysR family regulator
MDRLDAMSIVLAVAEAGSLSAAARQLKTPLATVSRKVSDLEGHLRTQLFSRAGRRLAPTEAGSLYVAACRRILAEVAEAERAAAGEHIAPRGELAVTAPVTLGRIHLIPILAEFLAAYPEIDVQLLLSDRVVSLLEDPVDVAIRIGRLPDSSLVASRIGTIRRVLCASPRYLAARGVPETPEALSGHDCVSYGAFIGTDAWRFTRDGTELIVPVHSRLMVGSVEAAMDAAMAGIGLTILFSYHVAADVAAGRLVAVLEDFQPPAVPVSLVHAAGRFQPPKLRAFLDYAQPRLRARLAAEVTRA